MVKTWNLSPLLSLHAQHWIRLRIDDIYSSMSKAKAKAIAIAIATAKALNFLQATLEEVVEADLLLHVLDASSPNVEVQREAVYKVLKQLGIADEELKAKVLEVWNKSDIYDPEAAHADKTAPLTTGRRSDAEGVNASREESLVAGEQSSRSGALPSASQQSIREQQIAVTAAVDSAIRDDRSPAATSCSADKCESSASPDSAPINRQPDNGETIETSQSASPEAARRDAVWQLIQVRRIPRNCPIAS